MTLVLVSYTHLDAPGGGGGVPRWNRDFIRFFPDARHYSFYDYPWHLGTDKLNEWEKARLLNYWLLQTGRIKSDDIVIVDGFWGLGLEHLQNVVSVAHGIWSHLTFEESAAGRRPEFPLHHAAQLDYRLKLVKRGGRIVSISKFLHDQMLSQFGLQSTIINNGIDLDEFRVCDWHERVERDRLIIIHGVTNANKGFEHIDLLKKSIDADVWLLDEAAHQLEMDKYLALAQADIVVHPSAFEGFGYFPIEAMACGVPVVAYNVGVMADASSKNVGVVLDRRTRSPLKTVDGVLMAMDRRGTYTPRRFTEGYSVEKFGGAWRDYLRREFGYASAKG
jgi:glycosyltransferase involved in cell wall biosynthesis